MPNIDKDTSNFAHETLLELLQTDEGKMILRVAELADDEDPLVSIEFSDRVKQLLGDELHDIGQYMIHAALQMIAQQQSANWHANVYDEEPTYYS